MYKLTRPDGFDFYSRTINYRDAIGTTVRVTDFDPPKKGSCGRGLHASQNPNHCFVGAKIPCAAFRVEGVQKIAGDKVKSRYQGLRVIEEITDLDTLFGWKYSEVISPIHPFKIEPPEIQDIHIELLKKWASVRVSVWTSVVDSVWAPVGVSVVASVRVSVGASVVDSVWASVSDSVRASVWASVWAPVGAYIGSLFPGIKKWKYIEHKPGEYPFQAAVDLWKVGLVPLFDGKKWRIHGGEKAGVLYETIK